LNRKEKRDPSERIGNETNLIIGLCEDLRFINVIDTDLGDDLDGER
jgi:hypothetical protein